MTKEQYEEWVAWLSKLTANQTEDTLTRIKLLGKTAPKDHNGKQEYGLRVLQAICDVLKKNNVETPSVATLKKSSAYVAAKDKFNDLSVFFEARSKSKLVQDQILRTAIELLYFDLVQWQGIAISSHTLLRQIHRIPATLNRHFPGYASEGLLIKLVKGM